MREELEITNNNNSKRDDNKTAERLKVRDDEIRVGERERGKKFLEKLEMSRLVPSRFQELLVKFHENQRFLRAKNLFCWHQK